MPDRSPRSIPLAQLAEPTEAPPPWDEQLWPSAPPRWHVSLPPSSTWTEEERDDVEYLDPLRRASLLRVPGSVRWCLSVLAVAFLGRVLIYSGDWADGLQMLAVVAGVLALFVCLVGVVSAVAWQRVRPAAFILATALMLVAVVAGSEGVLTRTHIAQATFAERTQQWTQALDEYGRSGASLAWISAQQARVELSWGQAAAASGYYATAITHLEMVLIATSASSTQQAQARALEATTYMRWIAAGGNGLDFSTALVTLADYANDKACATACQGEITAAEAQGYFEFGKQLQQSGDATSALAMYQTVEEHYAKSAFAQQAHAAAALVLAEQAQEAQQAVCTSAIPLVQQLATNYGDTTEGKQARQSLAAPVMVQGIVRGMPYPQAATISLIPAERVRRGDYHPTYTTNADLLGDFTFSSVVPGTYVLEARDDGYGTVIWLNSSQYVQVAPLCQFTISPYAY